MYHRHGHQCLTPQFVVKISLTYKRTFPILYSTKRKFLSKKSNQTKSNFPKSACHYNITISNIKKAEPHMTLPFIYT